jgi:hypothetical protein
VSLTWDGKDDYGIPVAATSTTYKWRALWTRARLEQAGVIAHSSSNPNFKDPHFLGEKQIEVIGPSSPGVQAVAVGSDGRVFEGSIWDEGGRNLRAWSASGEPIWAWNLPGISALAIDDDYRYAARATMQAYDKNTYLDTTQSRRDR